MAWNKKLHSLVAGAAAGAVNGLFGAGGGMILVPILSRHSDFSESEVFSSSVLIILPICLVSLGIGSGWQLPWDQAWWAVSPQEFWPLWWVGAFHWCGCTAFWES